MTTATATATVPAAAPRGTFTVDVSWGDCDPAGIVFYPRYFEWFDRAAHRFLHGVGLAHADLVQRYGITGLGLVDAGAAFRAPARQGDVIQVTTSVAALGRSTVRLSHVLVRGETLLVEGHEVRIWMVPDASRPGGMSAGTIPGDVVRVLRGG